VTLIAKGRCRLHVTLNLLLGLQCFTIRKCDAYFAYEVLEIGLHVNLSMTFASHFTFCKTQHSTIFICVRPMTFHYAAPRLSHLPPHLWSIQRRAINNRCERCLREMERCTGCDLGTLSVIAVGSPRGRFGDCRQFRRWRNFVLRMPATAKKYSFRFHETESSILRTNLTSWTDRQAMRKQYMPFLGCL